MVSPWRRVDNNAIPVRAKLVGSYVNTAFAMEEALGYGEAIVLDSVGHAVEGSAENLFIVREGQIITPPVTVTEIDGYKIKEGPISLQI
ncbi:MAG: aminotransferase class IV [bacterium]|nr:aminotransferase class IV [bacterium]